MKLTQNFKRILSALLVFVLVFSLMPVTALAADNGAFQTAAIFFSDVHGNATDITPVLTQISTNGISYSTVGVVGDTFAGTGGNTASVTTAVQSALNQNVNVVYAWGSNDTGSNISPNSGLLYSGKYYIYHISESDMATSANAVEAIKAFETTVASMDKTKVLFIMSHLPLHSTLGDNDNNGAKHWYPVISQIANTMDVVFFWGHNTVDTSMDQSAYYTPNNGGNGFAVPNGGYKYPNFTYMNAGFISGEGNSPAREGVATTVSIYANAMVFQDYNASGEFNGTYSHNVTVNRKFAPQPHTNHTYTKEVQAATCTQEGAVIYTCACGDTYTDVIPAAGHSFQLINFVNPSCTTDGLLELLCSTCNEAHTEVMPAPGHCFEEIVEKATCTKDGSTVTLCIDCGEIQSEQKVIPATGHNYETTTTEATCTKDGSTVTACTNCGDVTANEVHPATGHNYVAYVLNPSCTRYGYTKYDCSNCTHYYYDDETAPTGHKYTTVVTAPSCTNEGSTTSTCENCGTSILTETLAALGHNYTGTVSSDGTSMIYTCSNCEHSYSEEIISGYSYKKVTKLTTDDTFVITLYSNKKYYALSHEGNRISVVPVTVSNNQITSQVSENILWSHNNKRLYYTNNDWVYYLTTESTSLFGTPNLTISASGPATVSFSSSKLKVGSNYLRFSNNVVSLDRSATTTYLFKQTN